MVSPTSLSLHGYNLPGMYFTKHTKAHSASAGAPVAKGAGIKSFLKGPISSISGPMGKGPDIVGHACHPSIRESEGRKLKVMFWYTASSKPVWDTKMSPVCLKQTKREWKTYRMGV